MRKDKFSAKIIMNILMVCMLILSILPYVSYTLPSQVHAAKEGTLDSHGNIVPIGREEVDRSKPQPRGYGSLPQNTDEALAQGYSKRIGMTVNRGQVVFFWIRETEIVPKGEKPLDYINVYKLDTDVRGTDIGIDYGDAATSVDVKATRYIYDDGDFVPPDKNAYHPETDMMGPFRGLPPYDELPVPAYSFSDNEINKKYVSKNGKAEIGVFWGSADKSGEIYYCMNPNSVDPVENTQYFQINPKYDYQSNYRDVPETQYILDTLLYNARFYNENGSPNWDRGFDNLVKEFNRIVSDTKDTSSQEPGMLDERIKIGELRDRFNTLMGWNGNITFSGETMRLQTDEGTKALSLDPGSSYYDGKNDILALGFEYPIAHYMQGMPISEADKWFGRSAMWNWGNNGYIESRTIYGRAFARMIIAYTELAREKNLITNNDFKYEEIVLKTLSRKTENGKTTAKFVIDNVEAEGVSGYSIVIPEELHEKVKVTEPRDILEIPGNYAFSASNLKDGFTIEVDSSVTNEEIQKVKLTRYFRDKNLGIAYSAKNNYRYDEKTKRWYIREMVASDFSGYSSKEPQSRHGMGYGQELIKFSKEKNSITKSITLDLTQPVYDIKTTVAAEVYDDGIRTFKTATETSELTSVYNADQIKEGIHIKDIVAYKGLDKQKEYKLVGVLNEITDEENGIVNPIAIKIGSKFIPNINVSNDDFVETAKTEIDFGKIKNLKAGKKYVVYEYLFEGNTELVTKDDDSNINDIDKDKAIVKHENINDKAQTFKPTEPLSIKTIVHIGINKAEDGEILLKNVTEQELKNGISVYDRIDYTGLEFGKKYKFISVLNEINAKGEVTPVKATVSQEITARDNKTALVSLGNIKNLKPNTKYVIYEYLFNASDSLDTINDSQNISDADKEKALAKHENKEDKSQTFILQSPVSEKVSLTSQVEVSIDDNSSEPYKSVTFSSSKDKALVLPTEGYYIIDETLNYQGLEAGKHYNAYVYLKEKSDAGELTTVKVIEKEFFAAEADGSTHISFLAKVESGKKYVLHDYVVGISDEESLERSAGIVFRLIAEDPGHEIEESEAENILKSADKKYIHETADDDFSQSLEVSLSRMETTVKSGENIANGKEALKVAYQTNTITDIVKYSGLIPDIDYQVQGAIIDFENYMKLSESDKNIFDPFTVADKNIVISNSELVSFDTNKGTDGEIEVNFTGINLEEGKKYVVFERITSKNKFLFPSDEDIIEKTYPEVPKVPHVLNHFNIDDLKQTFFASDKPSIATIVKVGNVSGSAKEAATYEIKEEKAELAIVDTVKYENLEESKTYKLIGVLKNKTDNKIVAVKVGNTFTPNESKETEIDFGKVNLEGGKEYIVYEYLFAGESELETKDQSGTNVVGVAEADKTKIIASHEDDNDKAQSIVINREKPPIPEKIDAVLDTTVEINGVRASENAPVEVEANENAVVIDYIDYKGLFSGKEYTFIGRLMEISEDGNEILVSTSKTTKIVETSAGTVNVIFTNVRLEAGKKYVVYETAISTENLIKDGTEKHIVKHEDPNDKSQTVKVLIKPSENLPKTGNSSDIIVNMILLLISCIMLGIYTIVRRKGYNNK